MAQCGQKRVPALGLLVCLTAAALFGICNVIVKQVKDVDMFTIAFYRFMGIFFPALSVVIYRQEDPFPREKRWTLLVRSVMGASNLIIFFYGLKHMPLADTNMISAGSPIWCVIFARIFLKEKLYLFDIVNVFITLLGILFILQPPFIFGYGSMASLGSDYYIAGLVVCLGSMFLQSNVYILLRMLKGIHFSVTLTVFGLVGTVESAVFMFALGNGCVPQCGLDRYLMVAVGLLSFLAQILLTISLQLEEAGKISVMRKAGDILFAFLFQITIFHEIPGVWSVVGALLVSAAVLVSSGKKVVDGLPADHRIKTQFLPCLYRESPVKPAEDDSPGPAEQLVKAA